MGKVLIFLAPGFEEIEAISVIDLLRRVQIDVTVGGVCGCDSVEGAHKIKIIPDCSLESVKDQIYDAVILPGGYGSFTTIRDSALCKEIVKKHDEEKKIVAAICASPVALHHFGLLSHKMFCCYPSMKDQITTGLYVYEKVVQSENVITSQGPGTALDFSLHLVTILLGQDQSNKLKSEILYR